MTRILVTYATRFGSTHEIASAIAHELNNAGLEARADEASSGLVPDDYDGFVIGSPVYGGAWLPGAGMFAAIMAERMNGKPVALFSVGTTMVKNAELGSAEHSNFVEKLTTIAPSLNVISDTMFAGYFDRSNLSWWMRIVDRIVSTPQGDHRDWVGIKAWAKSLAPQFASTGPESS